MARRKGPANESKRVHATARLGDGIRVECRADEARAGDVVEAYIGDDLVGRDVLHAGSPGAGLVGRIELVDVPVVAFPAQLRLMNASRATEIGHGLPLPDVNALLAAAGAPTVTATFAGVHSVGPAFVLIVDRLGRYAREFALCVDGGAPVIAHSTPEPMGGSQRLVFGYADPVSEGARVTIVETLFAGRVLDVVLDAPRLLAGAQLQIAQLQDETERLAEDNAGLRRRLDTTVDIGREKLLLDRLDLFYLLLSERIERSERMAGATVQPDPLPPMPDVLTFGPGELDGVGIYDVETDGTNEWRWFGPDVTLALRDLPRPVRRLVFYFHLFGIDGPPAARVVTGGVAEPVRVRLLEDRFALDIPLSRSTPLEGILVLHLSFDRHQTSEEDPRLLSAPFAGAEAILVSA